MVVEDLESMINHHLELDEKDNLPWSIGLSEVGGRGVFATRDIKAGEELFTDIPIIQGPRSRGPMGCVVCLREGPNLRDCPGGCGLLVCQRDIHCPRECFKLKGFWEGERPRGRREQREKLFWSLTPFRGLDLSPRDRLFVQALQANDGPQHGFEVEMFKEAVGDRLNREEEEWMHFCCTVLDAVAFEVDTGLGSARGLYPLAGMLNHSCCPNVRHFFHLDPSSDARVYKMTMVASVDIKRGEELMNHYCPLLWGTSARRHYLYKTKHFYCSCPRCSDATEFGTYFSGLKCVCGGGFLVPIQPLDASSRWLCSSCQCSLSAKHATLIQAQLSQKLAEGKTIPQPENFCQVTVQMALHSIWIINIKPQRLEEITDEDLQNHENKVRKVLDLLQNLKLGQCRLKGLLSYQFYLTQKEWERRKKQINKEECRASFQEASKILKGDITAPTELSFNPQLD